MSLWKRKDQKEDQALISKDLEHGALAWGPRLLCSPNLWFLVWTAEQSRGSPFPQIINNKVNVKCMGKLQNFAIKSLFAQCPYVYLPPFPFSLFFVFFKEKRKEGKGGSKHGQTAKIARKSWFAHVYLPPSLFFFKKEEEKREQGEGGK